MSISNSCVLFFNHTLLKDKVNGLLSESCHEKRVFHDMHESSRDLDKKADQGSCSLLVRHVVYNTHIHTKYRSKSFYEEYSLTRIFQP